MSLKKPKVKIEKSLWVKALQWFYLLATIAVFTLFLWYPKIGLFSKFDLPNELFLALSISGGVYCLIIALSFFTQNTNLLILSLVLLFFTTILAGIMLLVTIPNAQTILSGNLPICINNLSACGTKDGVIVVSALFMALSVPILLVNLFTIIGAVKGIAATD